MPDPPVARHRCRPDPHVVRLPEAGAAAGRRAAARLAGYAELHAKTNFSLLIGASHPDELVEQAAALGYAALAVTDRNSLGGVVQAHVAARQAGLKLIVGAEVTLHDGPPLVLLATDRAAYGRLARLLTLGRRRAPKGQCELALADVAEHAAGLIACVAPEEGPAAAAEDQWSAAGFGLRGGGLLRSAFGPERLYALAELHRGPDDAARLEALLAWSRAVRIPLVAGGDVYYHVPQRRALHDVLVATRHGCTVAEAGDLLAANGQRHLKPLAELAACFARAPQLLARTLEIAARCTFSLDELRYEYPEELAPPGLTPLEHLRRLAWRGAARRYPEGVSDRVRRLLEHELRLIGQLGYEAYFLTVWDLVKFARSRGILCQGRGSAANSAVCYCLGITAVDPERMDVLFERFVSRERNEAPDIDVDFEHERREEVLQYLYDKYGRHRAGMTAEVITYRLRSAIRDVGKALGLARAEVDKLAKVVDVRGDETGWQQRLAEVGLDPQTPQCRQLTVLVDQLLGFPRHLSQHVGGMVITRGPLCELVPVENAAMPGRTVIQWDKDDLDALGILKVDCLALGMLTAIHKCFHLVRRHYGRELTLADVPPEDPAVYDMICRADTLGVFQIESRAQMSMLPRLRPRCFYDLVIEVAIVRPGPIQGDMVHPYLRRRAGEEAVTYPSDAIRAVLEKTLGVPIFQEQAMRLAVVAAGFSPGEADQLRRAMGAWRRPGVIDRFREKLVAGMQAHGLSAEYAQRVFQQISGFGEYGFPESHAASFALLVYVSAWLKHYYPAAFCAAVINSQPMGFYAPAQLVRDVREHGVEVRAIDVGASGWDCDLEPAERTAEDGAAGERRADRPLGGGAVALRLGFRLISGLSRDAVDALCRARQSGPFTTVASLGRRAALGRAVLVRLARSGVFGSLGLDRRTALWQALGYGRQEDRPLLAPLEEVDCRDDALWQTDQRPGGLEPLSAYEEVLADYATAGLSLSGHPLAFFRPLLKQRRIVPARLLAAWPRGRPIRVAGLVLLRQRPGTARGITFMTLEDETGIANLVVYPSVWQRYHRVASTAVALVVHGRLERQGEVIHVVVRQMDDLDDLARQMASQSRDFR